MCEFTNVYADKISVFFKEVAQLAASAEEITKAIHAYGEKWRGINN